MSINLQNNYIVLTPYIIKLCW